MQTHAKQIVALIHQLPPRDELKFLEKQPGNKKIISETNNLFLSIINGLKQLVGDTQTNNTIPFKQIEETLDQFLENAAIQHDLMNKQNAVTKQPQTQKAQKQKPKDLFGFSDVIQLSKLPFVPVLKYKQFGQTELDPRILQAQKNPKEFFENSNIEEFANPYSEEISRLLIPDFVLQVPQRIPKYRDLDPPIMINNADLLGELILKIQQEVDQNGYSEIAVDLEHHHQYSYLGITCLIQLSTRTQDYIIDPFPLWKQLGEMLSVIFANPQIVKVLHGAESDVLWLQRDFGLYIVNLFDTFHASKELQLMQNSFQFLLSEYCKKSTDKSYQTADWTVRPLTEEMIKYAQIDTHYLLYIYDRMRVDLNNLVRTGENINNIPSHYIEKVFKRSKETAQKTYKKPLQDQDQSLQIILGKKDRRMDSDSYDLMVKLLEIREDLGIQFDENPRYFLPNPMLFKLVETKPTNIKDLKYQLGGDKYINDIVKDNLWQILKVLLEKNEDVKPIEIIQQEKVEECQIVQESQTHTIEIEPIQLITIPVSIQKYQNQNQNIIQNRFEIKDIKYLNEELCCNSAFKLLNIFHEGLGTQTFEALKEQNHQAKQQVEIKPEQKIQNISTSDYIELPRIEEPVKEKKEVDIRLNNTLQNQYGTKILKRHQKIEQQRAQKTNISNRFELK